MLLVLRVSAKASKIANEIDGIAMKGNVAFVLRWDGDGDGEAWNKKTDLKNFLIFTNV